MAWARKSIKKKVEEVKSEDELVNKEPSKNKKKRRYAKRTNKFGGN